MKTVHSNGKSSVVVTPRSLYTSGKQYKLVITDQVKSSTDKNLNKEYTKVFTIK